MKTSLLKRSASLPRAAAESHRHAFPARRQLRSAPALQARQSDINAVSVTPADFQAGGPQLQQSQQVARLQNSPVSLAQLRKTDSMQFATVQRAAERMLLQEKSDTVQRAAVEEEELLQGKADPAQRMEEDEVLQGKLDAAQRMEEDEVLQGKLATAQRMEEDEVLQGKLDAVQRMEEDEVLQGKLATLQKQGLEEEEPMQGKAATVQREADPAATAATGGDAGPNKTGLPDNLKTGIETLSGLSLDSVKVHYNSDKPAQLNALAYAQGTDIHVASGQEQHLPHEAWHVVQQAQGRVKPTVQSAAGEPVNDDPGLENEADVMGAKAAQLARSSEPASNASQS